MTQFKASDFALSEFLIRAAFRADRIARLEAPRATVAELKRRRYDAETAHLRRAVLVPARNSTDRNES